MNENLNSNITKRSYVKCNSKLRNMHKKLHLQGKQSVVKTYHPIASFARRATFGENV